MSDIIWTDTHFITADLERRRVEHSVRVLEKALIVEDLWKQRINSFKQINTSLIILHKQLLRFETGVAVGSVAEQEALSISIARLTHKYKNLASQLDNRFEETFNINL